MSRRKLEPNEIVVDGQLIYIHLVGKNGKGHVAITDLRSFLRFNLGRLTWCLDNHGYACA
ncbi:hypothetical protein J7E63_21340 [Bacillus sp. ISL-75]|uniref:hypothetical protein n=1 Tax=Bacillus sp. ISL-75 TaxID=2819137 RepID=UPI001BE70C6C|nr:hypothetical protein [Bacillus sp. ISL-75]MBT2729440.1 hypothetical protein [Bacillus sp. ISL-75]